MCKIHKQRNTSEHVSPFLPPSKLKQTPASFTLLPHRSLPRSPRSLAGSHIKGGKISLANRVINKLLTVRAAVRHKDRLQGRWTERWLKEEKENKSRRGCYLRPSVYMLHNMLSQSLIVQTWLCVCQIRLRSEILPHHSQKVNHSSVPGHVLEGGKGDRS